MKKLISLILLLPSISYADDFPALKEGLWETVMTEEGQSSVAKHCVGDQSSLKEMLNTSKTAMQGFCSEITFNKTASGYVSKMSCNLGISKLDVQSDISGDFDSAYTVNTRSTMNPPLMGKSGGTSVSKSKYLGACTSDMKPGDVIMPDGKKMNVQDMSKKMNQEFNKIDQKQLEQMQRQMQQMMKGGK